MFDWKSEDSEIESTLKLDPYDLTRVCSVTVTGAGFSIEFCTAVSVVTTRVTVIYSYARGKTTPVKGLGSNLQIQYGGHISMRNDFSVIL